MPRQGGESGKIGDRYERLWVVDAFLSVLEGTARSLTYEPVGNDAVGVELFVDYNDGIREFLSAKRQKSDREWTISNLIGPKPGSRSILGDLFAHLDGRPSTRCVFVSSTGASQLLTLTEKAMQCLSWSDFQSLLSDCGTTVKENFESLCGRSGRTPEDAFDKLRRLTVRVVDEGSLKERVLARIRHLIHRPEPQSNDDATALHLIGEHLLATMGRPILADEVWAALRKEGFEKRGWVSAQPLRDIVAKANRRYLNQMQAALINGQRIPRPEADGIVQSLLNADTSKSVFVVAAAGVGKSCVLAQAMSELSLSGVPALALRLDVLTESIHAADVGRRMQLPGSPVVALAEIANGQQCVLIVDQLDAVSSASGRNQSLWDVVHELLDQAEDYSQMRIVMACRIFDLRNDPKLKRIRNRPGTVEVVIRNFDLATVSKILLDVGEDPQRLTPLQMDLLSVPLHLRLFLETRSETEAKRSFSTHSELFERYWNHKRKSVSDRLGGGRLADFSTAIAEVARRMTERESLEIPRLSCSDQEDAIQALLTEHVLVQDGGSLRFFHESFLDYAVARGFLESGRPLVETLSHGDQGLFCRGLVRQVLTLLRDKDFPLYLTNLRQLLQDSGIRYHVRKLVFAWLGNLDDPREDEWLLLCHRVKDSDWRGRILAPLRGRLPWFDLLHQNGTLAGWLHSSDPELVEIGWWQVSAQELRQPRSAEIAELIRPFLAGDATWQRRVRSLFRFGNAHHSRSMQVVFLTLFDKGAFNEPQSDHQGSFWQSIEDAAKSNPMFALEVMHLWLTKGESEPPTDRFGRASPGILGWNERDDAAVGVIKMLSNSSPREFVRTVFPFVERFVLDFATKNERGLDLDTVWPYRYDSIGETLHEGVRYGVGWMARNAPDEFEELFRPHFNTTSFTISELMLHGYVSNPHQFAAQCATFLQNDPRRLNVGHSGGIGPVRGDVHAACSREALMACVPHMVADDLINLETVILSTDFDYRIEQYSGWTQRLLLEAIGFDRLSATGQAFLAGLRDKFPQQSAELPVFDEDGSACQVVSPVPLQQLETYENAELLELMRRYSFGWDDPHPSAIDLFEGSAVELSREIQILARRQRNRFIALADAMGDDFHHLYFAEIVNGVFALSNQDSFDLDADNAVFEATATGDLLRLLRRVHRLPERPCGTEVCWAVAKIAGRVIPEADLLMVEHYALRDPSPVSDSEWMGHANSTNWSSMARQHGLNTPRGVAAECIASLLIADDGRMPILLPIVERMVDDPSDAVRSCVIQALLPIWNHDRDTAVQLFRRLCLSRPILWGTDRFELFGRYAERTHFPELREMLLAGLETGSKEAVSVTARLICLAAIDNELARGDAERVWSGSPVARRAAAGVYARNVVAPEVRLECETQLRALFVDPDDVVRGVASSVFRHIGPEAIGQYRALVEAYVESPAFPSGHDTLLKVLDESGWRIPEVTLQVAKRVVEYAQDSGHGDSRVNPLHAGYVAQLVVQLCTVKKDVALRRRCLDLLDRMEWLGFYGIEAQLREFDR